MPETLARLPNTRPAKGPHSYFTAGLLGFIVHGDALRTQAKENIDWPAGQGQDAITSNFRLIDFYPSCITSLLLP